MIIDNKLLLSLDKTTDELEVASQISMIIEYYVHGDQNTSSVFLNSEHISDQLMATHHSNILIILNQRFPQCFENPTECTSDGLTNSFSDQVKILKSLSTQK